MFDSYACACINKTRIEECYGILSKQDMLFGELFVYVKRHHKTQLQRDIEALSAIIDKKN